MGDPVAGLEAKRVLKSVPTAVSQMDDLPYLPKCSDGRALRDLKVWEVAELFIKPATSAGVCSFVQAFHKGTLSDPELPALMQPTRVILDHWRQGDIQEWRRLTGNPKFICEYGVRSYDEQMPATGHITWFVSHTWSRGWMELVDTVWQHYIQQPLAVFSPGHWDGHKEMRVLPIYYWVDIFAVSQQILNNVGAVSKHPDCQFSSVISAAQGTVLTLIPWAAPVSVSRVWCLFEVMRTLQQGKLLSLMPDRDFWEASLSISPDTIRNLVGMCVDGLDVGNADASFAADKEEILSEVAAEFGIAQFNQKIKQPMKERLMEALVFRAVHAKDVVALGVCIDYEATITREVVGLQFLSLGPRLPSTWAPF